MSTLRSWEIYTLSDPRTNEVRYVGMTTRGVKVRYNQHLKQMKSLNDTRGPHRAKWLKLLDTKGLFPVLSVVESGTGDSWVAAEKRWIKYYRDCGCDLTNLTDGGEGTFGLKFSPESIAKLREAKLRQPKKPRTEAQIRTLKELHTRQIGKKWSQERKKALQERAKGRVIPQYVRDALVKARKGVPLSEEHKLAVSRGHRARRPVHVQDGNELRRLYEVELKSIKQIAKIWKVSQFLVYSRLKEEAIHTRSQKEAALIYNASKNRNC